MKIGIAPRRRRGRQCPARPKAALCALCLLLAGWLGPPSFLPFLSAQTDVQLPVINIEKDSWNVLFQGFVAQPGSQAPTSEIEKITSTLAKTLQKLGEHVLNDNEKNDLREKAIREELYRHYKSYNKLVDQRDRAILQATLEQRSTFNQITAQNNEDKEIKDKARLIRRIQNMDRELISVPKSLPLKFTDQSTLLHQPANIVLLKEDYDFFIWGVANGRNNVFEVEMRAYIANSQREVLLWKGIVGQSNYDETMLMIAARASSLLLGRSWAAMKVAVTTSNGADVKIYLDGKLQGENSLTSYGLYPERPYELEIEATGLQGKHFFVELEAGKLNTFEFVLDQEFPEKYINVDASELADVYMGARYLGQTPLQVQVPGYETLLVLVAPDKRTINYDLSPEQEDDLYFELEQSPALSLRQENDKLRTRFYWSSALLVISLAVPLVATGIAFVNQGLYVNNINNDQGARYQQSMYIGFGVAIGGGVLSGILLGLNIRDFAKYTKSTRALATTEFEPQRRPSQLSPEPDTKQTPTEPAK